MRSSIKYVLAALVIVLPPFGAGGEGTRGVAPTRIAGMATPSAFGVAGGYLARIDPVTGELREEPPLIPSADLPPGVDTSHDGLVVEANRHSGGTMVNLQGRFQSLQVATIDVNGRVSIQCLSEPPDHGKARARAGGGRK